MTATQNATSQTQAQTLDSHFQNDLVNAIRDGKIVEIPWNQLTEAEKRQAYNALFNPCNW